MNRNRRAIEEWLGEQSLRSSGPDGLGRAPEERLLRLVVIDDDKDVANSLAMLMESFDAEVRVAYDGVSGVEAAVEFGPDMAFIDIRMPEVDGYETARRIRSRLGDRSPGLIALTGLGAENWAKRTEDAFDFHLTKPVAAKTLEKLLRRKSP